MKAKKPSFVQIFENTLDRVYAYVAYRVGNLQDTEDIVSEIFLNISRSNFESNDYQNSSVDAWVFTIARNKVIDFYRKNDRKPEELTLEQVPELSLNQDRPEEEIIQKEGFKLLHDLINALPPRQQEIIALRFFGHLKNKEISTLLGIEERTVSSHLSRGLKRLETSYIQASQLDESGIEVNDE